MTIDSLRLVTLTALALVSTVLGAQGLGSLWPADASPAWLAMQSALSAGWHGAWLAGVLTGRSGVMLLPAMLASLDICRRGLLASGFNGSSSLGAFSLEATILVVALQYAGRPMTFAEQLAAWRRGFDAITAQLRLAHGSLPRLLALLRGSGPRVEPGALPQTHFADLVASLGDLDTRIGHHISASVLPEQLRQSLLTRARDLAAQSELAAIEASLALEHQALTAAAAFRDECAALSDISENDRDAVARGGQAFLLDSITRLSNQKVSVYG